MFCRLHSKRFRGVGEQRKTKERNWNGILPTRNWGESQNKKEGVGRGRKETLVDKPLDFENETLVVSFDSTVEIL